MARKRSKSRRNNLSLGLVVGGLLLMTISLAHNLLRLRALSLNSALVEEYSASQQTSLPLPTHLKIPWYIDVDIVGNKYENNHWTVSETTASYLLDSARPQQPGNIIIYGHNKRSILGNIRALQGGELITLKLSDNTTLTYKVTKLIQVKPSDTTYLEPTSVETLTLYTCAGLLDSERFIVQAVPVASP